MFLAIIDTVYKDKKGGLAAKIIYAVVVLVVVVGIAVLLGLYQGS